MTDTSKKCMTNRKQANDTTSSSSPCTSKTSGKTRKKSVRQVPKNLYDNLRGQIEIPLKKSVVNHIWKRHGCYENAKFEQSRRVNKGKMPSYFESQRKMEKAIVSTVNKPNWTRASYTNKKGKRRGQHPTVKTGGIGRFRGRNYRKNLKKHDQNRKKVNRKLHFKLFTKAIGVSGQGYSIRRDTDHKDCFCCCSVIQPEIGLITAYPIITEDAQVRGCGPKENIHDDISSMSTSSSKSEPTKSPNSNATSSEILTSTVSYFTSEFDNTDKEIEESEKNENLENHEQSDNHGSN